MAPHYCRHQRWFARGARERESIAATTTEVNQFAVSDEMRLHTGPEAEHQQTYQRAGPTVALSLAVVTCLE